MATPICPVCCESFDPNIAGRCSECGTSFLVTLRVGSELVDSTVGETVDRSEPTFLGGPMGRPVERHVHTSRCGCGARKTSTISLCGNCGQ